MYIVADIGSTNTRIAKTRGLDEVDDPIIYDSPAEYAVGMQKIIDTCRQLANGETIEIIAVGVPGSLSTDRRRIFNAANLSGWDGYPFAEDLEKALGTTVSLENDTMQVGQGEAVFGAGKGNRIVVYMTVSTGVNAVRVVDGKIEPSVYGYETGYQYLSLNESEPHLMDMIGGLGVQKRFGMHPKELGKDHPLWEQLARVTAFGLHNTILHWSPDIVVLGGSMFNEIGISVERVDAHLKHIMKAFPSTPRLVHSSLGAIGGLYGGLARLRQLR